MAFSWRAKRKFFITLGVLLVIGVPILFFIYTKVSTPPTCFDDEQNQGEVGVDCGGPCDLACAQGNDSLVVLWDRSIRVANGLYNAVAYVDSGLEGAAAKEIKYTLRVFDRNNDLLEERIGTTFVNPGEIFAIFEPRIKTNGKIPARTFLSFEEKPTWIKTTEEPPEIIVKGRKLVETDSAPRLQATLKNSQLIPIQDISIVAIVYDIRGNAIGVSGTYVEELPRTGEEVITFTWPEPFEGEASRVEIIPRVSVFKWESAL